jgi:hypothetical protein
MRYLKAVILCSMGWFERKLTVVSVVVDLRNTSISRFVCLRVIVHSRMFIRALFSYVGLSFMLYIWFMCALMLRGLVLVVSFVIRMSSTHRVCSSMFVVPRSCRLCTSSKCYRNILAITLEMGDPTEIPCSGW